MPTLAEALNSLSKTSKLYPTTSETDPQSTTSTTSTENGQNSETTTLACPAGTPASTSAGIRGAVMLPNGKEQAKAMLEETPDKVALSATTSWLPQPIAHWLTCMEYGAKDMEGRLLKIPPEPELLVAEAAQLKQALWMLGKATLPSRQNPTALLEAVKIAMLELPFRARSSEEHVTLTIKVWADAVSEYPLWAVEKAARWWSQGARDGDDLGHFVGDVRLACGHNVLRRKKALEKWAS